MMRWALAVAGISTAAVGALGQGSGYVGSAGDDPVWTDGLAGPARERAEPLPPPMHVTEWLWLAGELPPLAVYLEWVADGAEPPREGDELDGAPWVAGARPVDAAWAFATVELDAAQVRMARLTDAEVLFANGEGFFGDPADYGFRGVPVALRAGRNQLFVAGIAGSFELELWSPPTRCVIATWDVGWPLTEGRDGGLFSAEVIAPVHNASLREARELHVHYGHVSAESGDPAPRIDEWRDPGAPVPPLAMFRARTWFWSVRERDAFDGRSAVVPLCVWAEGDAAADRQLLRGPFSDATALERRSPWPERTPAALGGSLLGRHGSEPRVLVHGTAGTDEETRRSLARARFDQQLAAYVSGTAPELVSDRELLRGRAEDPPRYAEEDVVVYGNEDTNAAWRAVLGDDLPLRVRRGRVELPDGQVGGDAGGWIDLGRAAAVLDSGPGGSALGYFARWIASPLREGDFAVYHGRPAPAGFPVPGPWLVASGRVLRGR